MLSGGTVGYGELVAELADGGGRRGTELLFDIVEVIKSNTSIFKALLNALPSACWLRAINLLFCLKLKLNAISESQ